MYYNNKGSVLIFTLIVFSIVNTITMMCIGLNYSNSRISNLNYKSILMREYLLSSIELVHSNTLKEVSIAIENSENQEQFKNYFLANTFLNNIKNDYNDTENINDYEVKTIVKQDNYYYKCFKVIVEVNKNSQIRRLESYVLQQ